MHIYNSANTVSTVKQVTVVQEVMNCAKISYLCTVCLRCNNHTCIVLAVDQVVQIWESLFYRKLIKPAHFLIIWHAYMRLWDTMFKAK